MRTEKPDGCGGESFSVFLRLTTKRRATSSIDLGGFFVYEDVINWVIGVVQDGINCLVCYLGVNVDIYTCYCSELSYHFLRLRGVQNNSSFCDSSHWKLLQDPCI